MKINIYEKKDKVRVFVIFLSCRSSIMDLFNLKQSTCEGTTYE